MLFDGEAIVGPRIEGVGVAIDDVLNDGDGRVPTEDTTHIDEDIALAQPLDVIVAEIRAAERQFEFVGLANIEHKVAHGCISFVCDGVQCEPCRVPAGSLRVKGLP